ncbi:sugar phosphate isomerase/epimerase family protein [Acuticoccus sediminis]|uniref:sugar phosphate isomerase/epimerase family protein n=1 Tax=Acuticoccus sediminis TaxID=2184697 RepID=UPI001CFD0BDD|nr:sugar phosphate isomerase/epimerase family protein [Acuticoccus sediminis]
MLRFAYNTNGCAYHRLDDALELIAESGYQGVALTLDANHFDPLADDYEAAAERLAARLRELDLGLVVETGALYLLDPREAQEPSLLHPTEEGRKRRIDLIRRAVRIGEICEAEAVTFFAGRRLRSVTQENAGAWLLDGLCQIAEIGSAAGVTVALEPVPGQMIGTLDDFMLVREALKQMVGVPPALSLDVGHCLVTNERDPASAVKEFAPVLGSVAIEDMVKGVHEHLPLGQGDMDIRAVLTALDDVGFEKLISVELPLQSMRAHEVIPAMMDVLQDCLPSD